MLIEPMLKVSSSRSPFSAWSRQDSCDFRFGIMDNVLTAMFLLKKFSYK